MPPLVPSSPAAMSTAFKVACLATRFKSEIQQVVQVDLLWTRELGRAKLCPLSLCYLERMKMNQSILIRMTLIYSRNQHNPTFYDLNKTWA